MTAILLFTSSPLHLDVTQVQPLTLISVNGKDDYIINRLDVNQYGELRGLFTTHVLVGMANTWMIMAKEMEAPHVVLLDYRKASDSWITQCY